MTEDFTVENHGTIVLIVPWNADAESYLLSIVPADVMRWGEAVVAEPRYVQPILDHLMEEGFTVSA